MDGSILESLHTDAVLRVHLTSSSSADVHCAAIQKAQFLTIDHPWVHELLHYATGFPAVAPVLALCSSGAEAVRQVPTSPFKLSALTKFEFTAFHHAAPSTITTLLHNVTEQPLVPLTFLPPRTQYLPCRRCPPGRERLLQACIRPRHSPRAGSEAPRQNIRLRAIRSAPQPAMLGAEQHWIKAARRNNWWSSSARF